MSKGPEPSLEVVADLILSASLVGRVRAALELPAADTGSGKEGVGNAATWIVGGAIRDAALGREVRDIDLAVSGDPEPFARRIASALGGHSFELSAEFPTWRAGDREKTWQVDVATLRGPGIIEDLALRDFTVGAMAVSLETGEGLDPNRGLEDLAAETIRAVGPTSFSDDPLRLMRAARLAAQFGWDIDPDTLELGRASANRCAEPAGERTLSELCLLMASRDPVGGLAAMEGLGLLDTLLPEVGEMRGVVQGPNHHLDVYGHTVEVLEGVLRIESELDRFVGGNASDVAALLDEPLADGVSRSTGLRLAALFHDCAKPTTRKESDGFISFRGHDREGAGSVLAVFSRLRSSRRLATYVADLTRNHLILGFMVPDRPLSRGQVFDYLKRTEPYSVDVTLLTVADRLAARGTGSIAGQEMVAGHLELAREMVGDALAWQRSGPPEQFLPGNELADRIGIEPGPELGRIIDELDRAVFCGEVGSASEAVDFARRLLDSA
ncbi:MAG: HD domain-containing protein [Solirubrobacterales bacterium]